jgi:hypothetical protein
MHPMKFQRQIYRFHVTLWDTEGVAQVQVSEVNEFAARQFVVRKILERGHFIRKIELVDG